jgi:hypothetical protein
MLEHKTNKVFKVQPILDAVRRNCIKTEPEEFHSIDEQIIPAKTKCSRIRKYNPKNPVKWGFKNFVRAGKSGIIYDFFLYQGGSTGTNKCNGDFVVKSLCKHLPSNENHKLMFDNWFTTLNLCLSLKTSGILCTATIRSNRIQKCPLSTDKELKKHGRGSSSVMRDKNSNHLTKRFWLNGSIISAFIWFPHFHLLNL